MKKLILLVLLFVAFSAKSQIYTYFVIGDTTITTPVFITSQVIHIINSNISGNCRIFTQNGDIQANTHITEYFRMTSMDFPTDSVVFKPRTIQTKVIRLGIYNMLGQKLINIPTDCMYIKDGVLYRGY